MDIAIKEYIGAREVQADYACRVSLGDRQQSELVVIADGAGSHDGAAIASKIAIETFMALTQSGEFNNPQHRRGALLSAVHNINQRINKAMKHYPQLEGMGTTVVAAIISSNQIHWVSVGDSHLFLLRDGNLVKLNEDHSLAGQMVRSGQYSADHPELNKFRHLLVSALNGEQLKLIDLPEKGMKPKSGDMFIIATDGIDTLPAHVMNSVAFNMSENSARCISDGLINSVKKVAAPHQDNITVATIKLSEKNNPVIHKSRAKSFLRDAATLRARAFGPLFKNIRITERTRHFAGYSALAVGLCLFCTLLLIAGSA